MKFDLFICYTHANIEFARSLEIALKQYYPPIGLKVKKKRLKIFRDETEASGNDLTYEIKAALENSNKLIVLCSTAAYKNSYWINKEIDLFVTLHPKENVIPVIIDGLPNSEAARLEKPLDSAFPGNLLSILEDPWSIDYRNTVATPKAIRKKTNSWYHLLSCIYSVSRSQIEQREQKRKIRTGLLAIVALFILVITLLFFINQRNINQSLAMAQDAKKMFDKNKTEIKAAQLAIAAVRKSPTSRAMDVLKTIFSAILANYDEYNERKGCQITVDSRGSYIALANPYGTAFCINLKKMDTVCLSGHPYPISRLEFSPDSKYLLSMSDKDNIIRFWNPSNGKLLDTLDIEFASSSRLIFLPDASGFLMSVMDGDLVLKKFKDLRKTQVFQSSSEFDCHISFAPDGKTFILWQHMEFNIVYPLSAIRIYNCSNGELIWSYKKTNVAFDFISFPNNGKRLVAHSFSTDTATSFFVFNLNDKGKPIDENVYSEMEFNYSLLLDNNNDFISENDLRGSIGGKIKEKNQKSLGEYGADAIWLTGNKKKAIVIRNNDDSLPVIVDLNTFEIIGRIKDLNVNNINSMIFKKSGNIIFIIGYDVVVAYSLDANKKIWGIKQKFSKIVLSEDETKLFITNAEKNSIDIYSSITGESLGSLADVSESKFLNNILYYDKDDNFLISATGLSAYLWDIKTNRLVAKENFFSNDSLQFFTDQALLADSSASPKQILELAERRLLNYPKQ